jgi:SHS2 domain-containing protein
VSRRLVEHVGEVELALASPTEEGVFEEAAAAFRELVDGSRAEGERLRREIVLHAEEPALLLVDWLNELLFLAEVERFVSVLVERLELADGLSATVAGVRGRPRHLVKGATLNGLELTRDPRGWHGHVVLDV